MQLMQDVLYDRKLVLVFLGISEVDQSTNQMNVGKDRATRRSVGKCPAGTQLTRSWMAQGKIECRYRSGEQD